MAHMQAPPSVMPLPRRAVLGTLGAVAGLSAVASGCVRLPPGQTGVVVAGQRVLADLRRRAATLTGTPQAALLQRAADRIVPPGAGPGREVLLLEGAWAGGVVLPAGTVCVFAGLLVPLTREAELAALLALYRAQLETGAVLVRLSADPARPAAAFGLGGLDGSPVAFAPSSVAAAEVQAVRWLAAAGYDPQALARMWSRLAADRAGRPQGAALAWAAMAPGPPAVAARNAVLAALGYRT